MGFKVTNDKASRWVRSPEGEVFEVTDAIKESFVCGCELYRPKYFFILINVSTDQDFIILQSDIVDWEYGIYSKED